MSVLSLNSALLSLDSNLNSPVKLVDSRDEQDLLNFISHFGKLLNFYTKENKHEGSWQPFLLKDPLFLMAFIGGTDADETAKLFRSSSAAVQLTMNENSENSTDLTVLNVLFHQVFDVFKTIVDWSYYFENSSLDYPIKNRFLQQIQTRFSIQLWAFIDLNRELSVSKTCVGIRPNELDFSSAMNSKIWNSGAKQTYQAVFDLDSTSFTFESIYRIVEKVGIGLIQFYKAIVNEANEVYPTVRDLKSDHPDTLLIRTFLELLKVNQSDMNGLVMKHLNYYYDEILQQRKRKAIPDQVYLMADLASNSIVYKLPAGTLFDAGLDATSQPIQFVNTRDQFFNSAKIANVVNLRSNKITAPNSPTYELLSMQNPTDVGVVQLNGDGMTIGWDTFGTPLKELNKQEKLAIAFASPMLLLREGERLISLSFAFKDGIDPIVFKQATYFLSTKSAWFPIKGEQISVSPTENLVDSFSLSIKLSIGDPAIEGFEINPDNYISEWPLLKIEFSKFGSLANPPLVEKLTITTTVQQLKTLELSNDNGILSAAKPFMPFGPVVLNESAFNIGNLELFSKPLTFLSFDLIWDKLPKNFEDYYQLYNSFLGSELNPLPVPQKKPSVIGNLISTVFSKNWVITLIRYVIGLFKKIKEIRDELAEEKAKVKPKYFFNNSTFTVKFEALAAGKWQPLIGQRKASCDPSTTPVQCLAPPVADPKSVQSIRLFNQTDAIKNQLSPNTTFSFGVGTLATQTKLYNPLLQKNSSELSEKSTDGFIRMVLSNPVYGFGSEIYPKVISQVTLVNAQVLINQAKAPAGLEKKDEKATANQPDTSPETKTEEPIDTSGKVLLPPPNPPYAPIIKSITANYRAEVEYTFDYDVANDPIVCYHYTPFSTYQVYSSSQSCETYHKSIGLTLCGPNNFVPSLPLFARLDCDAVLYIELVDLVPGNRMNLFIELSKSPQIDTDQQVILEFYYLTDSSWLKIDPILDETNKFTCSGIVEFDLPTEMDTSHLQMSGNGFWLAVRCSGNPDLIGQIVLLKTNGAKLQRASIEDYSLVTPSKIEANTIKAPLSAIPEITETFQPFTSFGGKKEEDLFQKNRRVANQMKIKGRPLSINDFNRLIQQDFESIFYSKVNFDKASRTVFIRIIKRIENQYAANAFLPLVTTCEEQQIETYFKGNTAIDKIKVTNFDVEYLTINATVYIQPEFELSGASKRITQALKIFLSPWIKTNQAQITIDQGITDIQLATFLTDFQEVSGVENITFQLAEYTNTGKAGNDIGQTSVQPNESVLLVPSMNQSILWKKAV